MHVTRKIFVTINLDNINAKITVPIDNEHELISTLYGCYGLVLFKKKVAAIKKWKKFTNCGLREAKYFTDELEHFTMYNLADLVNDILPSSET